MPPFETLELRRYVTHPGRRDALIALFERAFLESQEAAGMCPAGHYRDLDDPNLFVWLRGFEDAGRRGAALTDFYGSAVWREHRAAANATMADSDNVLLLRDAAGGGGLDVRGLRRPPPESRGLAASGVAIGVFMLREAPDDAFLAGFEATIGPTLRATADRVVVLVTDPRPNDFPALPVRAGEHALVAIGRSDRAAAADAWNDAFTIAALPAPLRDRVIARELHRLEPAARSLFR